MSLDEIKNELKGIDIELDNGIEEISSNVGKYIAALRSATAHYISGELSEEEYRNSINQWKGDVEKNTREEIIKMEKLYNKFADGAKELSPEERKKVKYILFKFYSKETPEIV